MTPTPREVEIERIAWPHRPIDSGFFAEGPPLMVCAECRKRWGDKGCPSQQYLDGLVVVRDNLIRELVHEYHHTGSIRDHADPKDRTGWNVKGIETCNDTLCVEARLILEGARATDDEGRERG